MGYVKHAQFSLHCYHANFLGSEYYICRLYPQICHSFRFYQSDSDFFPYIKWNSDDLNIVKVPISFALSLVEICSMCYFGRQIQIFFSYIQIFSDIHSDFVLDQMTGLYPLGICIL